MLDAVGVDASVAWANPRNRGRVFPNVPNPRQFRSVLVVAEIDGERFFLDPSDSRCAFGGLPPALHGVTVPTRKVSPDVPLLAEVLRDDGFLTIGLTAGRFLAERFGFDRGFEHFNGDNLSFARALGMASKRIAEIDAAERFFVFIHTYAVHCPYDPPPKYAARFATRPEADRIDTRGRCGHPHYNRMSLTPGQARFISDRYDGSIRYADDVLGEFLERLERSGRLATTLVAITSDHGEEFLEHGKIGHRGTLYIQSVRVPWLMAGPGLPPSVVAEPVSLADVMPTLLDLLGVSPPPMRGISMLPVIRGEREADRDRLVFSQNDWGPRLYSAVVGDHHIIVNDIRAVARIYDWREDPEERTNLAGGDAGRNRELWLAARSRFTALKNDEARVAAERLGAASARQSARTRASLKSLTPRGARRSLGLGARAAARARARCRRRRPIRRSRSS